MYATNVWVIVVSAAEAFGDIQVVVRPFLRKPGKIEAGIHTVKSLGLRLLGGIGER